VNRSTVWVVYNDSRKNMSAAEKFGNLKDVFSSVGKIYNGDKLISHARNTLKDWKHGDHLLMVGDPTLCGICVAIVSEMEGELNILRWDRINFDYTPLKLVF